MNLIGGDFDTPHRFSAGDTISADMMNEIFDYIKNSNKMISASELFGTWTCELYTTTGECFTANSQLAADKKWDNGTDDQLNIYNTDNITFIEDKDGAGDPDGTYSYTTPLPNMFNCADASHGAFGKWIVQNNVLFMTFSSGGNAGNPGVEAQTMIVKLKKVTNTKILMEFKPTKPVFAECDKCCQPPIAPTLDNVTSSGKTVTLTWTDNSNDETGFNVWRTDSNKGSWDNVTSSVTFVDATATDTVTEAKKYSYRVSANNIYGESTRSKVIQVDVE
jgi:hypothetical protein